MAVTVRLFGSIPTILDPDPTQYTGRWTLTVDPFDLPPGADGNINEFDVMVTSPMEADTYIGLWVGNDSGTPADLTAGFTFDSDSAPGWASYVHTARYGPGGVPWADAPDWAGLASIYDGDWDLFSIGPLTVDPDSDPSWFPPPPPPAWGVTSEWTVVAVDAATGASPVTLPGVAIGRPRWALNEAETVELTIRTTDDALAEFLDPTREIQIIRDGTVLFWGPAVRVEIDDNLTRIQCAGPWWYLTRRFFGKADRTNLLTNGDFEAGTTGWTGVGLTPIIDPTRFVEGTRSIKLTGTAADHDTYFEQVYTHTQVHPQGDDLTIAAWVWVSSADYQGDAGGSYGLLAERRASDDTTILDVAGDAGDDHPALINAALIKDEWHRFEVTLPFVKDGDKIHVRLYPPFGSAWWDLAVMVEQESLAFEEQDMATIIRGIVGYAQGEFFDHGKSDLNIAVAADPTGVTLSRAYQFADHQNIADELAAFTHRRGGVDYAVEVTATTRTLVVSHPHRGTVRDDLTLTYSTNPATPGNIVRFRLSHDRVQKADSAVVLGPGDGPDREEGGASVMPSGPTLEDVTIAPDGTTVAELDRAAAERLAVINHPEVLEVTCMGVLGDLVVGDWVPVLIDLIDLDDTYRVVALVVDPANDSVVVTLNLRDPETPEEAMARFPRAVDACLAPDGGVWVVGSDGGVGAYGGATFHGSLPDDSIIPNAPVVAIVPHGADGYWLVAADTGIFAYGDAPVREGYAPMIDTEYAAGDRAIIAAEAYDPGGDDTLIVLADDGSSYIGAVP